TSSADTLDFSGFTMVGDVTPFGFDGVWVNGLGGTDTITGTARHDILVGHGSLYGMAGDDELDGGGTLDGGDGNDTINTDGGITKGGAGNDTINAIGGVPNTLIDAGAGDDTVLVGNATI